ncbi:TPA: asparagine synthase, partial [Streptococcus pneumoniae]
MKLSHVPVTLNNKKIQEFMRNGFILDSNTLVTEINKLEY